MKYFLIVLFISIKTFSQDLTIIKDQGDVILVLFEGNNDYQKKRKEIGNSNSIKMSSYTFRFENANKNSSQNESITLNYNEFYDFDELEKDNPVLKVKINKSFIKKNKDQIITQKFMWNIGYEESCKLLDKAKTILLVDKSEIKNKKIVIKEVAFFYIRDE